MAKGKFESDTHIATLQDENKNLRAELALRQRLEEMVDQLGSSSMNTPPSNHEDTSGTPVEIDENYINNILDKREKQRKQLQNLDEVKTKLKSVFGDDYKRKLEARAAQLKMSKSALDQLAMHSPDAFMALVSSGSAPSAPYTPPSSSVSFTPNPGVTPRTKAWYDKLKKENPTAYWSAKVQYQMHQDAIAAAKRGEDF